MKHLYLLFALAMSLQMSAQVTIQNTFNGCQLGKTPKAQVLEAMSKVGATSGNMGQETYSFIGSFDVEGVQFPMCMTVFVSDTLCTSFFVSNKQSGVEAVMATIKTKYEPLPRTMTDNFFLQAFRDTLASQFGVDPSTVWSRMDDATAFALIETPAVYCLVFVSVPYYYKLIMDLMKGQMNAEQE